MSEKDQAIKLLSDMRVRWLDAADGYREAGIIYADQLLRDATDEIDNVRAVLSATPAQTEIMPQGLRVPADPAEAERWALENIQALQDEMRQRIEPYATIFRNSRNSRPAPFDAWWEKPKG